MVCRGVIKFNKVVINSIAATTHKAGRIMPETKLICITLKVDWTKEIQTILR